MAPKKKTNDKLPAGTGEAVDSSSTTSLTIGKDPNQSVSAASETTIPHPTTWNTCTNNPLTKKMSKLETSENITQTPRAPTYPKEMGIRTGDFTMLMKKHILITYNPSMEQSPLVKAGVKVAPPYKYGGEQTFEALETFIKGLLRWLDMHSKLGPAAYKYQVLFLRTRLESKALKWFNKIVEPRMYQGTPMDLEEVVAGLYNQ
ncbi:hypothetical protein M422DRAFT_250191 [Sphaerobolus stellatus SS14]|uniref:Uncharacterized protein n=1 Tax=Sphaerobolus stellatus (strain SS14) TaxID=990650 RepID=A0A0C9W487_SPHS4|nr:hypothetical protein M422DRAFT_250191 [Sphaerobolus stellatus SS14]